MQSGGCAEQHELGVVPWPRAGHAAARRQCHARRHRGLLCVACLRSRVSSYPLQCKALELYFNIMFIRLATVGGPMPAMLHHAGQRKGQRLPLWEHECGWRSWGRSSAQRRELQGYPARDLPRRRPPPSNQFELRSCASRGAAGDIGAATTQDRAEEMRGHWGRRGREVAEE
jgi:hypothetical protein